MDKNLIYFIDLICEKIDLHADAFIKRVDALKKGDMEGVEFIERMMLEPLNEQITYLAKKASSLCKEKKINE